MKKQRRFRVSAFSLGITDKRSSPAVHKASRSIKLAQSSYVSLAKKTGTEFQMVILHQGNLKADHYKIIEHTNYINHYTDFPSVIRLIHSDS